MARMFPREWENRNGSPAEALVYRRLRDETPDDWLAVHSVGLTSHRDKPWAELDFVVVGPFGVLCLEVKGGHITVEEGRWYTNGNALKESPFRQAGSGSAALHGDLDGLVPGLRRAVVGHGVVLPDVRFTVRGAGIADELVYDESDLGRPFRVYLERLGDHWLDFHGRTGERYRPLSRAERSAVLRVIAPSFDLVPSLRSRIAELEAELIELTNGQSRVLRGMRDQARALVRGGAGTGKTLLAVDEAARFAAGGMKVLLCCRSAALAAYLADHVEEELVEVRGYRRLLDELVDDAGRRRLIPDADDEDVMSVFLPEQANEAVLDLDRIGSFDAIVVDEAQDLMIEGALDVFDSLLDGGLDAGKWRFFADHKQNVFDAVDRRQYDRISSRATTQYQLVDNCRNTPQISDMTALMAAVEPDEALASSGPEVSVRYVLDHREDGATAAALIERWCARGVDARDTVVLAVDEAAAERFARRWPDDAPRLARFDGATAGEAVQLATAAEFKGLEAVAAVVVGIDELTDRRTLRAVYVACSRPRALLGVVLHERARQDFDERAIAFARRHPGP